eukprot:TRINITY_DN1112_c0_g1_i2.p1 TRINITY_DN1112_c0_g1~~TRINITY_DN1112_c0_g1_i2.p1  ORF type:complete len:231 (+),score=37.52 TRINITY_DN1112_c0_g1_i2:175-867(+)
MAAAAPVVEDFDAIVPDAYGISQRYVVHSPLERSNGPTYDLLDYALGRVPEKFTPAGELYPEGGFSYSGEWVQSMTGPDSSLSFDEDEGAPVPMASTSPSQSPHSSMGSQSGTSPQPHQQHLPQQQQKHPQHQQQAPQQNGGHDPYARVDQYGGNQYTTASTEPPRSQGQSYRADAPGSRQDERRTSSAGQHGTHSQSNPQQQPQQPRQQQASQPQRHQQSQPQQCTHSC